MYQKKRGAGRGGWSTYPSAWSLRQPSRVEGGGRLYTGRRGGSRGTLTSEAEMGFVFNQVSIQKRTVEKYKNDEDP